MVMKEEEEGYIKRMLGNGMLGERGSWEAVSEEGVNCKSREGILMD